MKGKVFIFLFSLLVIGITVNSCKKSDSNSIKTVFTGGTWQLASLMVYHYVGSSIQSTDTLNSTCTLTQHFTFNSDNTCTYSNFDCLSQPLAKGTWSVSRDQLFLSVDMAVTDTVNASTTGTSKPFSYAQIVNLGNYSLVLRTGDIATAYTATSHRTIMQYGFVRQKTTN